MTIRFLLEKSSTYQIVGYDAAHGNPLTDGHEHPEEGLDSRSQPAYDRAVRKQLRFVGQVPKKQLYYWYRLFINNM